MSARHAGQTALLSTRHAEHLAHALSPADCSCKPVSRTAGQGRTVLQAQGWSGRFECGRAAIAAQRWVLSAQGRSRMGTPMTYG